MYPEKDPEILYKRHQEKPPKNDPKMQAYDPLQALRLAITPQTVKALASPNLSPP